MLHLQDVASKLQYSPKPDFSVVGVKTIKQRVKFKLSEIKASTLQTNTARISTGGTDPKAVEKLRKSMAQGWQENQYLPAVYYNADNVLCLVYGYNRFEVLSEFYDDDFEFCFDVLDCDSTNIREVRLIENEGLPSADNTENNIVASIVDKIKNDGFDVADTETYLKKIFPHREQTSISRIVGRVEESQNYQKPIILYTLGKFNQWLREYSSVPYLLTKGNNKDKPYNGHYTFMAKNGYQYRALLRGAKKYVETGTPMALIGHVESPVEGKTLTDKRIEYIETLAEVKSVYENLGADMSFCKLLGFLPQDRDSENLSKLITVKEVYAQQAKEARLQKAS